jgi:hypothetical protein
MRRNFDPTRNRTINKDAHADQSFACGFRRNFLGLSLTQVRSSLVGSRLETASRLAMFDPPHEAEILSRRQPNNNISHHKADWAASISRNKNWSAFSPTSRVAEIPPIDLVTRSELICHKRPYGFVNRIVQLIWAVLMPRGQVSLGSALAEGCL